MTMSMNAARSAVRSATRARMKRLPLEWDRVSARFAILPTSRNSRQRKRTTVLGISFFRLIEVMNIGPPC